MITKYAKVEEILEIKTASERLPFDVDANPGAIFSKFASLKGVEESDDGYLYVRCRAISSRVNKNNDGWPSQELAKSYKTFIGRPIFVDHNNDDPSRARGVIVDARLHVEDDEKTSSFDPYYATAPDNHKPPTWIELLLEVDSKTFPKLAAAVRKGQIDAVSMGANIETSVCSVCDHSAKTPLDYCKHISSKGAEFEITSANGEKIMKKSYEDCHDITFFEISFVFDPADPTALISERSDKKLSKMAKDRCECWDGYERVPDTEPCEPGSCRKCDERIHNEDKKKTSNEQGQNSRKKLEQILMSHPQLRWSEGGTDLQELLDSLSNGEVNVLLDKFKTSEISKAASLTKESIEDIPKLVYPIECQECGGTPVGNNKYLYTLSEYTDPPIVYCDNCGSAYYKEEMDEIAAEIDSEQQGFENDFETIQDLPVTDDDPSVENVRRMAEGSIKESETQILDPQEVERNLNHIPQSEMISSPSDVDTLKEDVEGKEFQCPNCQSDTLMSDAQGMLKCPSCSWVQPPHPLDNPDLSIHLDVDVEDEPMIEMPNKEEEPKVTFFDAQSNTIINKMTWNVVSNKVIFDRTSAVPPKKIVLNPSYVTKTEDPKDAKVISDQKVPVTSSTDKVEHMENEKSNPVNGEKTLLRAIALADDFVQLGLIDQDHKLAFVAQLEDETAEALEARKATITLVKEAGLAKPTSKVAGLSKVPKFASFKGTNPVDLDDVPFESIFM